MPTATQRNGNQARPVTTLPPPQNPIVETPPQEAPALPAGILRWEEPYSEPVWAQTLRDNPGRWAVVYEGSGLGWAQSPARKWLTEAESAQGFRESWLALDADGRPIPPGQYCVSLEIQSKGTAYVRYGGRQGLAGI